MAGKRGKPWKAAKCLELPSAKASSFRLKCQKPARTKLARRDFEGKKERESRLSVARYKRKFDIVISCILRVYTIFFTNSFRLRHPSGIDVFWAFRSFKEISR